MVTRLLYFIFLVAVTVVCSIVLSPTVADALQGTVSQLNKIILELLYFLCSIHHYSVHFNSEVRF